MRRATLCMLVALLAGCAIAQQEHFALFFQPKSAGLDDPARQMIQTLATKAKQRPNAVVTVIGYTDPGTGKVDNLQLAAKRVNVVTDLLLADGVAPGQLRRQPMGGVDYSLDSIESRRVEITIGQP